MITGNLYNELFSLHGTIMIFLWVIPVLTGVANFIVPLQIGAQDMAFPKLNALSLWLAVLGGLLMLASFVVGGAESGWSAYPPLSEQTGNGQTLWALASFVIGFSSIFSGLNFLVTILNLRASGMTLMRLPLFSWSMIATLIIILGGTPALAAALALMMWDRGRWDALLQRHRRPADVAEPLLVLFAPGGLHHDPAGLRHHFRSAAGVRPQADLWLQDDRLLQHGHRHLRLPGLGAPYVHQRHESPPAHPLHAHLHDHRRADRGEDFSWLATIWGGRIRFTTSMLFASSFIAMFVIGGLSGVFLASIPIDIDVQDSYFVVAHLHYVLFGGTVQAVFAGLYFWFPKITGRMLNERLGKLHFWITFIGFNLTFLPQHWLGLEGMPRRVFTYPPEFAMANLISSIGAFVLGIAVLPFLANILISLRTGKLAGANPWRSLTLEWTLPSPPPIHNFPQPPVVVGDPYGYGRKQPPQPRPTSQPAPTGGGQ